MAECSSVCVSHVVVMWSACASTVHSMVITCAAYPVVIVCHFVTSLLPRALRLARGCCLLALQERGTQHHDRLTDSAINTREDKNTQAHISKQRDTTSLSNSACIEYSSLYRHSSCKYWNTYRNSAYTDWNTLYRHSY